MNIIDETKNFMKELGTKKAMAFRCIAVLLSVLCVIGASDLPMPMIFLAVALLYTEIKIAGSLGREERFLGILSFFFWSLLWLPVVIIKIIITIVGRKRPTN